MADIPRSSFIPKQTTNAVPSRVKKRRRFGALTYAGNVILVVSLLGAAGTFFYTDYLTKDLENTKMELDAERSRFNDADIEEIRELDRKFSVAKLLLDNHLSPSKIFDTLELTTKENVQFTNFEFSQLPSQNVEVAVKGGTEEFKTVARQALTFGSDPLLKNAVFTDVTNQVPSLDNLGSGRGQQQSDGYEVSFTVQGTVTGSELVYDGSSVSEAEPETPETTVTEDAPEEENGTTTENVTEE